MRLSEIGFLQNVGLVKRDSGGESTTAGRTEGRSPAPAAGGKGRATINVGARQPRGPTIKGQRDVAPKRTTAVTPAANCPKGTVSDGKGGCKSPKVANAKEADAPPPVKEEEAPPVVAVLSCPTGTHLNKPGTACLPDTIEPPISVPDGGTKMTEEPAEPPAVEPKRIQVTTPNTDSGGGTSSGGGSYGGPSEPEQKYADPVEFQMPPAPPAPKFVGRKVAQLQPDSTADRTALYVGGVLAALGVGYFAFKKFKSGERT